MIEGNFQIFDTRNKNYSQFHTDWMERLNHFFENKNEREELLRIAYPGTKKQPLKGKALGNFLKERFKPSPLIQNKRKMVLPWTRGMSK